MGVIKHFAHSGWEHICFFFFLPPPIAVEFYLFTAHPPAPDFALIRDVCSLGY